MGLRSRNKGKRGELQFSKVLKKRGFAAHRGAQNAGRTKGGEVAPDIYSTVPNTHFEVKYVEKLNIYKAMEQAKGDAADGVVPVVAHRKNREDWLITMSVEDYLDLVEKAIDNTI